VAPDAEPRHSQGGRRREEKRKKKERKGKKKKGRKGGRKERKRKSGGKRRKKEKKKRESGREKGKSEETPLSLIYFELLIPQTGRTGPTKGQTTFHSNATGQSAIVHGGQPREDAVERVLGLSGGRA